MSSSLVNHGTSPGHFGDKPEYVPTPEDAAGEAGRSPTAQRKTIRCRRMTTFVHTAASSAGLCKMGNRARSPGRLGCGRVGAGPAPGAAFWFPSPRPRFSSGRLAPRQTGAPRALTASGRRRGQAVTAYTALVLQAFMMWQPGLLGRSRASLRQPVTLSSQHEDPGDRRIRAAAPGGTGLLRAGGPSRGPPATHLPSGSRAAASRRVAVR